MSFAQARRNKEEAENRCVLNPGLSFLLLPSSILLEGNVKKLKKYNT